VSVSSVLRSVGLFIENYGTIYAKLFLKLSAKQKFFVTVNVSMVIVDRFEELFVCYKL